MLWYIFGLLLTIVAWATWGAGVLSEFGQLLIVNGSLTGFEAFLAANLNLWFIFFAMVAIFFIGRSVSG